MKKLLIFISFFIILYFYSCDNYMNDLRHLSQIIKSSLSNEKTFNNKYKYHNYKELGKYGHVVINNKPFLNQIVFATTENNRKVIKIKDYMYGTTKETSYVDQFENWLDNQKLNNCLEEISSKVIEDKKLRISSFKFKPDTKVEVINKSLKHK